MNSGKLTAIQSIKGNNPFTHPCTWIYMSLTHSGHYYPILTNRTIHPGIVLKSARKSHFTIRKKHHTRASLLPVVENY